MSRLLDAIKTDIRFLKSHTLQPAWYKVLKVFILLAFLIGYWVLFGFTRTAILLVIFALLSLIVHMVYRIKTKTWTQNWRDLVVVQQNGASHPHRIGALYYLIVILNAAIAALAGQLAG